MVIRYALEDETGNLLTDSTVPPFSAFSTPVFSLPGTNGPSVTHALFTRSIVIPETAMIGVQTMSELMDRSDDFPGPDGQIEYSQAFGFAVKLLDVNARSFWRVRPAFILMVASSGLDIPSGQSTLTSIGAENQLGMDFCGLNRPDIVGVWAIVDSQSAYSEPDLLVDAQVFARAGGNVSDAIDASIADALSPDLMVRIQDVLDQSSLSDTSAMQRDILRDVPAGIRRAAVIPDYTGGFSVPLRNRFFLHSSSLAGNALLFCAVTITEPYTPLVAFGTFPAYSGPDAATADTGSVNGIVYPPIAVPGYVLDPVNGDDLMYFIPVNPISTSGYICGSQDVLEPLLYDNQTGIASFMDPLDQSCQSFLQSVSGGRRKLHAVQAPLSFQTMRTAPASGPMRPPTASVRLAPRPLNQTLSPPRNASSRPPPFPPPIAFRRPPPPLNSSSIASSSPSSGIGPGAITGITIGALCAFVACVALIVRYFMHRMRASQAGVGSRRLLTL